MASGGRVSIRINSKNKKLLRWIELAKLKERGYTSSIISTAMAYFLTTGEMLNLGTVNPELCASTEDRIVSVRFQKKGNDVAAQSMDILISSKTLSPFIVNMLDSTINEGTDEHLLSLWDLQVALVRSCSTGVSEEKEREV